MRDVGDGTGEEVVQTDHLEAAVRQALTEVAAEEAGPAGHNRPWGWRLCAHPPSATVLAGHLVNCTLIPPPSPPMSGQYRFPPVNRSGSLSPSSVRSV